MQLLRQITDEEYLYESYLLSKKQRGILTEIHIADIHFGALDPEYQYNILKEQFLNKINKLKFDILSINGDLFEHKFMSNSNAVMYAIKFIDNCVNICRSKNATLVLIEGTEGHDGKQLKLFYHYLDDSAIDIRIVEQVRFEFIKGAKILCIPELYGKGKEYYDEYLLNSGYYDSVFMHGHLRGAIRNREVDKGLASDKAPIFSIDDFKLCRGPIISGHVHVGGCFNKHFYYCGSALRFQFGEEQDKGFYTVLHNLDSGYYFVHFEEIKSYRYITLDIDYLIMEDPHKLINFINEKKEKENIDYYRIKIDKELSEKEAANLEILKSYYRQSNTIKLDYKNHKNKEIIKVNEEALEKYREYDFILDDNLNEYQKLAMFINKKEKCQFITGEELKQIVIEENII